MGALVSQLRERGHFVFACDKQDGRENSLDGTQLAEDIIESIDDGLFDFVFECPPCKSFAPTHDLLLRPLEEPEGGDDVPPEWSEYIGRHNRYVIFCVRVARACHAAGIPWLWEHPAAHHWAATEWPANAHRASVWDMEIVIALEEFTGAASAINAQCAYGSEYRKFTRLLGAMVCRPALDALASRMCTCKTKHKKVAKGRDAFGRSLSAAAAVYPTPYNTMLADVIEYTCEMCEPVDGDVSIFVCGEAEASADPSADKTSWQVGAAVSFGPRLHVGSSRPHELDGASDGVEPPRVHAGSLRLLEPELSDVLSVEPLPETNVIVRTDPEDPPDRVEDPPGPFTDDELLNEGVYDRFVKFGSQVVSVLKRALGSGEHGWKEARDHRPTAFALSEEEALRPAAHGFTYRKLTDGLWHAIQPSVYPEDPPVTSINIPAFVARAEKEGLIDEQALSWIKHGMPGSEKMPRFAQAAPPHVGALQHASIFCELADQDLAEGYVTGGFAFPDIFPCCVDPMNVVVQKGKGRVTIDKTMHVSGDPSMPSFNLVIVLEFDEAGRRYKLVSVRLFARGIAILQTAVIGTPFMVEISKFDLKHFFRRHGKQRLHLYQGGRLTRKGYGTDLCTNFGERHAPDHTGRVSNAVLFFVRRELKRLQYEYPTVVPEILAWLAHRVGLRDAREVSARMEWDDDFVWEVLFFIIGYVDDFGMAVINDLLYDRQGRPVFIIVTENDGTTRKVHQGRALLFFEAAIGVVEEVGHLAPMKKRAYPGRVMTLLGIGLDLNQAIRYLDADKAESYGGLVVELLLKLLTSGSIKVEYKALKSLVHKLLHAAETIPLGRAHLFHLRRALYHEGRLEGRHRLIGTKARRELEWWRAALALPELFAVPMASRVDFPTTGEAGLITHYGDASREYDEQNGTCGDDSGYGAWSMIDGTFCFFDGRWEVVECARYSINVLELHVENMGAMTFAAHARSLELDVTHVHTFIDNSSAENVAERGRTATAGMNELNVRRQQWLVENNVHQRTSRVASVFNDIADLLSRGDIAEALRFAIEADLPLCRLIVDPIHRTLDGVPFTWDV